MHRSILSLSLWRSPNILRRSALLLFSHAVFLTPYHPSSCSSPFSSPCSTNDISSLINDWPTASQQTERYHTEFRYDRRSTYSLTIKGNNIDFCQWSTCGFRMINPTNLATFIGNPLRLVESSEKKSKLPSTSSSLTSSSAHDPSIIPVAWVISFL
jgi:hypothetical protein